MLTERIDDSPLLLTQMDRMGFAAVLDAHFPTHGNWQGLACGRVATIWVSAMRSRGAHRLVHGEPWVAQRPIILRQVPGEVIRAHALRDDRLARVLRLLSDDSRWTAFAAALHPPLVRGYARRTARVHVDSTSASAQAGVSAAGLCQLGHRQAHRPACPQGQVRQAVLDPWGMPRATAVVSGNRADAPLSVPGLARVQARWGRRGFLSVGDCERAAREPQDGESELRAEGYERQAVMACEAHGASQTWRARRVVVRSRRHAKAAAGSRRARVAPAHAQVEAWHPRGRGRKRFAEPDALRQAATALVQRHPVEDVVWLRYDHPCTSRPLRGYRNREAGSKVERQATVEVRGDEEALARAGGQGGWRVAVTHQPSAQWSLAQAVLAYRRA